MRSVVLGLLTLLTGCGLVGYNDVPAAQDAQTSNAERCSRADTILCDSFDSEIADDYTVNEVNNGEVRIDTSFSFHGAGAMRGDSPDRDGNGAQLWYPLPEPVSNGQLHVSARVYLSPGEELTSWAILLLLEAPDGRKISLDGENADVLQLDSPQETTKSSAGALRRGEWSCLELGVDLDSDTASAAQGELALESLTDDFVVSQVHVGLWAADNEITVWIDDLYVGRQASSCP